MELTGSSYSQVYLSVVWFNFSQIPINNQDRLIIILFFFSNTVDKCRVMQWRLLSRFLFVGKTNTILWHLNMTFCLLCQWVFISLKQSNPFVYGRNPDNNKNQGKQSDLYCDWAHFIKVGKLIWMHNKRTITIGNSPIIGPNYTSVGLCFFFSSLHK